jgi:hypothetical protein
VQRDELMYSENYYYGKSTNAADRIPKVGRRTQNLEREIERAVQGELIEKEKEAEERRNERFFDTTGKTTFVSQDLTANVIGRKVMKT